MASNDAPQSKAERLGMRIRIAANNLIDTVHEAASNSTVYLAGSGYDFEEFAVPFAERFTPNLAGVACLWTHQCEFGLSDTTPFFTLPQVYAEPAATWNPMIIYCQTLIPDADEVSLGLHATLKKVASSEIVVVASRIDEAAALRLESGIEGFRAKVISEERRAFGTRFRDRKSEIYATLDDRVMKPGPLMSAWLIDRITRPKLDFTPTPVPPKHPPAGRLKRLPKEEKAKEETGLVFGIV